MEEPSKHIIISDGQRPLWHTLVASACYSLTFLLLYLFIIDFEISDKYDDMRQHIGLVEFAIFTTAIAIRFSLQIRIVFNIRLKRYKREYSIGPLAFGKWHDFKHINYISVFKKKPNDFRINLWYDDNRHHKISNVDDAEVALKQGIRLAEKFNVKVWDATKAQDEKWL